MVYYHSSLVRGFSVTRKGATILTTVHFAVIDIRFLKIRYNVAQPISSQRLALSNVPRLQGHAKFCSLVQHGNVVSHGVYGYGSTVRLGDAIGERFDCRRPEMREGPYSECEGS
jgi:hypothetical protein